MFLVFTRRQMFWMLVFPLLILFLLITFSRGWFSCSVKKVSMPKNEISSLLNSIFYLRNQALLEENLTALGSFYNRTTRNGIWAYEHQARKMAYLHNWCFKQGVELSAIKSLVQLRRFQSENDQIRVTLLVSTEYRYNYLNQPTTPNMMRIGTYHLLDLVNKDGGWKITREWYTDPFFNALKIKKGQTHSEKRFILSQEPRNYDHINPQRIKAVAYADTYCGAAADDEKGFKYNPKYKNYNYSGGDCANFVSQVLHEGGGFHKTSIWNYVKDGSQAWTNAHAFNRFMLDSGRASLIAIGSYTQVLKDSYQLYPGDYIAYEKKGSVTHISLVTGTDSRGYVLTNSHNADRYRVPWDLGYGDPGVRFWLVKVHY